MRTLLMTMALAVSVLSSAAFASVQCIPTKSAVQARVDFDATIAKMQSDLKMRDDSANSDYDAAVAKAKSQLQADLNAVPPTQDESGAALSAAYVTYNASLDTAAQDRQAAFALARQDYQAQGDRAVAEYNRALCIKRF
jgi:hypothetical protein